MKLKSSFWSRVVLGAAASFALVAGATIATPTLFKQYGYMNGYFHVCFNKDSLDYQSNVEVEMKPQGADDSAYARAFIMHTANGSEFNSNGFFGRYYRFATNLVGTVDVRVRLLRADDASEWMVLENPVSGYPRVTGTVIGTNSQKGNGFDGNMFSICDGTGTVGYDFGAPIRIKGIRWFGRPDNGVKGGGYGDYCFNRIIGSTFEYANDASFSDQVTILTCTRADQGGNTSPFQINEHWFSEPVTARYIRYNKQPSTARGGLDELEVIPWDCPYKPVASVVRSDITNFWPVLSWTYQAGLDPTQVRVERATAAEGPFTPVSDWADAVASGGSFTNSAAYGDESAPYVGVQYYYRVVAKTGNPSFIEGDVPQEVASTVVSYRRLRRLDRAWGAEGTLLPGVSVMAKNADGDALKTHLLAWDGNAGTWPDEQLIGYRGPVGLQFAQKTSVVLFGYICRTNNYCFARIKNTAVYSAATDDTTFAERVKRSADIDQATQDATFYLQDITSISEEGADCWFLYVSRKDVENGYFGGNVAEVMFFGWDEQDIINAGVLIAPKTVTFANTADHLGVVVSWDTGANATDGYTLERRARGSEGAWTEVCDVAAGVTTCTDMSMTQGYWDYRVAAKKGASRATSAAFSRAYYAPGGGDGLKRIVYWPFSDAATSFTVTSSNEFENGAVDFDFAYGTPICTDGPTSNMFLACEGTLVVPFAGSYTITHETSDGGSVWIDGVSAGSHWAWGAKTTSSVFELSAGEHAIQVYTRFGASHIDGRRKAVLRWSGPVGEETIPACQLKPAADFYTFDINKDWTYRQFGGNDWGRASVKGNVVTLRGSYTKHGNRGSLNVCCAMMKGKDPYCELEFKVDRRNYDLGANGVAGVIVHADNGNALLFGFDTNNGGGSCQAYCHAITNGIDSAVTLGTTGNDTVGSRWYRYMRLVYEPGSKTFRGFHKYELADEWTEVFAFKNGGSFNKFSQIGFFATGSGATDQSGSFNITVNKFHRIAGFAYILR